MAQRWHYIRNGQECGPVSTADLRLLADSERLLPTDTVRAEGSARWVPASNVKGLFYAGPPTRRGPRRVAAVLAVLVATGLAAGGVVLYASGRFRGNGPVAGPAAPGPASTADQTPGAKPGDADPPGPDTTPPGIDDTGGDAPGHRKSRTLWRSSRGYFENTGGDKWVEKNDDGVFNYVERERTAKFIELFDFSRNITVRLHPDHYDVKTNNRFERKTDGTWEVPHGPDP